jgi:membrane protein implicated in regulation of membrane protease activity
MEAYVAWLILGFVLLIIEMTSGTFYLLVLGVASFGAAAAAYLGQHFPVQVIIAAAVSAIGAYLVHAWHNRNTGEKMKSIDAGMPARFESWTDQATRRARVRYRDASWDARIEGQSDVQPGATVYVRSSDGNTLHVAVQPPD